MGVCLDTCHVFDGGYDIVHHLDDVLMEFDNIIGLDRLKAIHINDSKNVLGSHKDRHEKSVKGILVSTPLQPLSTIRHCDSCPIIWKRRMISMDTLGKSPCSAACSMSKVVTT